MSTKKIAFGPKPSNKTSPGVADAWVDNRDAGVNQEKMKRLTIDIPESLHRTIKAQCAQRGSKIVDEVRELLSEKYGRHA